MSTDTTIVLITGAAAGLGFATVQALLESPAKSGKSWTVIITSRSAEKSNEAVQVLLKDAKLNGCEVVPTELDLDNDDSVERLVKQVKEKFGRVDVVVNNACQHLDFPLRDGKLTTREAFNRAFNTNVTSTHLFTQAFMPLLLASASPRLVFISSGISSLGAHSDMRIPINLPPSAGWPKQWTFNVTTYRTSKTAGNMMALEWARLLKNDGVKVFLIDPGRLATGLGGEDPASARKSGAGEPIDGGRLVKSVIEGDRDEDEGVLITKGGVIPW
ncbi:hypothetical protein BCR39DRAFT_469823 [Naematelia encephala]|uniref:Uncharacterized protein n=1 Tax=Naematelia encephala TaxID=71784 RepID=A0A1Y2AWU0_9TREE|nr:hypothetical protein BCR39DRAFT_469823 [Naematelia encephala]